MSFDSMVKVLIEKMRLIVEAFRRRAKTVKQRLEQPPTPTDTSADGEEPKGRNGKQIVCIDWTDSMYASKSTVAAGTSWQDLTQALINMTEYIDPRGPVNIAWLAVLMVFFLYNAWVIPFRFYFPQYQTSQNLWAWFVCDYVGDIFFWLVMWLKALQRNSPASAPVTSVMRRTLVPSSCRMLEFEVVLAEVSITLPS